MPDATRKGPQDHTRPAAPSCISSFADLPVDILLHVFAYLDVPEILRLRRSSKSFQQLTAQYPVWHHAYHNSPLLLQTLSPDATVAELERAVVKAERLDRNLSSPFPRIIKSRLLRIDAGHLALFRGRYLVSHVSTVGLSCHDLDLEDDSAERPIAQFEDRSLIFRASGDHDEASGFLTFLKEYGGANAGTRYSVCHETGSTPKACGIPVCSRVPRALPKRQDATPSDQEQRAVCCCTHFSGHMSVENRHAPDVQTSLTDVGYPS
ncbi:hypothetical protein BDV98DRAFT_329703 [Pterulicium gracile]|uniref:F-box domain-containing protein n=1 Tax=Pterulicium gracile TaxID=1884261 RepID=A0A5C3QRY0_9AGAR|nr:hypothetical protein BDV98DRAFT_329703 [Pterula gracilis]